MGKSADLEYLEEERKKLWVKVLAVEANFNKRIDDELSKKASDYSDEAKQSSRKASEYRNRSEESKNLIVQYLDEAEKKLSEIKEVSDSVTTLNSSVINAANESSIKHELVKQITDDIEAQTTKIDSYVSEIEAIYTDRETLIDRVNKIQEAVSESEETATKIETLHKSLLNRKKEIDQVYLDIFGYTDKDEASGKDTVVDGLKTKLEKSYDEININLKKTEDELAGLRQKSNSDFQAFESKNSHEFDKSINSWNDRYTELAKKIEALLPNALTAGLSSAFSEKKDAEIKENADLNKTFNKAIWGLVVVSLIPFIISLISINEGKSLEKALLDMPRLVLSILPLYVPILWVAYSSNRKMNLSKRLSEEYSHKEVLSKTFEGLATQINNIEDEKVSIDLKYKLLYNLLEVSSENPGKLISDYNKSDYPLMDALDKSVKLATAVKRLENIPGFKKIAKLVDKKSKSLLEKESEMANKGIDDLEMEE